MPEAPEYLNIAQIITTVGVRGEMKVRPETDDPLRLKQLKEVSCLLADGTRVLLHPTSVKQRGDGVVIAKFAEYDAPEPAAVLRRAWLQVLRKEAKREPGKVLYADVIGMQAIDDATGAPLGVVTEVLRASQDILEIRTPKDEEVLVPWVDAFVKSIDLDRREVRLTPIEGLFDA